jgi:exosortase
MSVSTTSSASLGIPPQSLRQAWPWPILVATAVFLGMYGPVLMKLARDWWVLPDFSHGIFVPIFAGYLVWTQRSRLAGVPLQPSWSGLLVVIFGQIMFIAGQLGAELFISRSSLLIGAAGLIVLFCGWKMLRALLFPWLFLFLMIPIPALVFDQITFPLQLLASQLASWALPLLNVPVLREGNIIHIPAMPLEVAEACSGIRSLMTLGTLAIVYSYLAEKVHWRRVVLVIASIPLAVVANSVRVVGTGLCVQYGSPRLADGFFHEFSGWIIFMASLLMLYTFHLVLRHSGRHNA